MRGGGGLKRRKKSCLERGLGRKGVRFCCGRNRTGEVRKRILYSKAALIKGPQIIKILIQIDGAFTGQAGRGWSRQPRCRGFERPANQSRQVLLIQWGWETNNIGEGVGKGNAGNRLGKQYSPKKDVWLRGWGPLL